MRIVAALGGNALLRRGEKPDAATQEANVDRAVHALAPLAHDHELVLTHGNGPQVGVLAMQSASDPHLTTPYPFDVLGAQTQGMIGYWLLQALQNALPGRQVASIINQTLVLAHDPAFANPTKFVGEVYTRVEAERLAAARGWTVHQDGGGVPVIRNEQGKLAGVEAVVDKDLTAAVLAEALEADVLLILTDVPHVERGYGTPTATPILRVTPAALRRETFAAGSM